MVKYICDVKIVKTAKCMSDSLVTLARLYESSLSLSIKGWNRFSPALWGARMVRLTILLCEELPVQILHPGYCNNKLH